VHTSVHRRSWSEALGAVDRLESEARRPGLALDDSKTVIRKRETYEEGLPGTNSY